MGGRRQDLRRFPEEIPRPSQCQRNHHAAGRNALRSSASIRPLPSGLPPLPPGPVSNRPISPRCGRPWPWPSLASTAEAGDILAGIFTKFPNSTRFPVVLENGPCLGPRPDSTTRRPAEAVALVEKLLPHAEGREGAAALAMDRADAVAAIPARQAESVALYAAVAGKFPKDPVAPQALYLAGYGAMTQGDFAGTLQYTDAFLAAYPTHELVPDVRYVAAESRLQLGKYDEAEKLYAELLQKYPQHPDAESWKVRQGTALHLQKKYPEVVALLQPLAGQIKSADARAEALFLIGSSLAEQKQFAEAVPSLEAALAAAPRWRQADETLLVLGQAYYRQKDAGQGQGNPEEAGCRFPPEQGPRSGPLPSRGIRRGGQRSEDGRGRVSPGRGKMAGEFPAALCLARAGLGPFRSEGVCRGGRGLQHAGREISRSEAETPQPLCPRPGAASLGQVRRGGCRLAGAFWPPAGSNWSRSPTPATCWA